MDKTRVLVVEDEAIVAAHIEDVLGRFGFEVVGIAATGERAIDLAVDRKPDIAIMDLRLAGQMDGEEAARQIRARTDVPIVFLTAHADDAIAARARLSVPFGYLLKPIRERELKDTIEIALDRARLERERERLIHDLQAALAEVKTLSGLLPICASCKKIRNAKGDWEQIERYIAARSEAEFSHGICPECATRLYPDYFPPRPKTP